MSPNETQNTYTLSVQLFFNMNTVSRIMDVFSGQGYSVDSLSFGAAKQDGQVQLTLTTHGEPSVIEQIIRQLHKIVDVIDVTDLTHKKFVNRELALVKVFASAEQRSSVAQVAHTFNAEVVDVSPEKLSVEVAGHADKIDAFLNMVRPFGIDEVARTGTVAVQRENAGAV